MTPSDILFAVGCMGRVCLGLVFITAALGKLRHGLVFEGVLANYRILPRRLTPAVAAVLPWAELGLGGALLLQLAPAWTSAAAGVLLIVFAWAMAVNLQRGRSHIDCGCHRSSLRQPLHWSLVGRNLVLAALLAPSLAPSPSAGLPLIAVGLLGGALAYLLYLLFNAIAALPFDPRSVA